MSALRDEGGSGHAEDGVVGGTAKRAQYLNMAVVVERLSCWIEAGGSGEEGPASSGNVKFANSLFIQC